MADRAHRWTLDDGVRHHEVVVHTGGWRRRIEWNVDGELIAEKQSAEDSVVLDGEATGAVRLTFSMLGSARRVNWFDPDDDAIVRAHAGLGGLDMDPEPGSPAARRDERMRAHPKLYAARHVAGGVGKVVVPILLTLIAIRFTVNLDLPRPNLPTIPRPNLPDLPSIPWPDLPSWSLPGWLREVLSYLKYVWPILLGIVLARAEIQRRRKQDEKKAELRARRQQPNDEPAG